jgi:hypothetical protein
MQPVDERGVGPVLILREPAASSSREYAAPMLVALAANIGVRTPVLCCHRRRIAVLRVRLSEEGWMKHNKGLIDRARRYEHRLVRISTVHARVHGRTVIQRFNTRLAVGITVAVGSMWCAYAFAALAFVSLPAAIHSGSPVVLVSWISQTFLQLVLLAIIMVGQRVLSEATDARAESDHETLQLLHEVNLTQLQILQELRGTPQSTAPDPSP